MEGGTLHLVVCGFGVDLKKDIMCFEEIGVRVRILFTILGSIVNTDGRDLYDHFGRKWIFAFDSELDFPYEL